MEVMIVDDEPLALERLQVQLSQFDFIANVYPFPNPYHALEFLQTNVIDLAILDIEMFGLNGIELAARCKLILPQIKIIFLTGYSNYAMEAFSVHANGYLLKPVSDDKLKEELLYVTSPVEAAPPASSSIRIQTFGNFEVFVDGIPVEFDRNKSKELLAYLVIKRGAYVNGPELLSILYEDKPLTASSKSQLRTITASLIKSLKEVHAEHLILKRRGQLAINTTCCDCDYYNFLDGDVDAINQFMGEFMSNYSWAEFITGYLEHNRY